MINTIDNAMDLAATLRGIAGDTIDTLLLLADNSVGLQEASIEAVKKTWTAIVFACCFVYFVGQVIGEWWWSQDPIEQFRSFVPAVAEGLQTGETPKAVLWIARSMGRLGATIGDGLVWMLGDGGSIVWAEVLDRT